MDNNETFTDSSSFNGEVTLKVSLEYIDSKRFYIIYNVCKRKHKIPAVTLNGF